MRNPPDQVRIGTYNNFPLWVPRSKLNDMIGKVAYFRRFGGMMIYIGHGESFQFDVCVNCPVHPETRKIEE